MAIRQPELHLAARLGMVGIAMTFILASAGALDMRSVRELFNLAKRCYAESNRALNPDVKETLRNKADDYMLKADELRCGEIIQGVFPTDKNDWTVGAPI